MCPKIWLLRVTGFICIILSILIGAILLAIGTSSIGICSFAFGFPFTSAVAVNSCNDTLPGLPMRWLSPQSVGCRHLITGDCVDITSHARAVQVTGIVFFALGLLLGCFSYCEAINPCGAYRKKLLQCCE